MSRKTISRRTLLRGAGTATIALPLLEEMISPAATAAAPSTVPVRAFNVFFGLGIPAPLQTEGFRGVLEPLEPLGKKLLIMRNVDQVRCDERGINAHYDGASGAFTAEPPDGEARSGGPSIEQVIRQAHYPDGLPPGMVPTLVGGTFFRRSRVGRYVHSYNLDGTVAATMQEIGSEVACVILEPVVGNMGVVAPVDGFLEACRELCTAHGSLLIFDEVMTGFRVAYGGAQSLYGVTPDMTTLGKIVGGGMPVGAFGGKKAIMEHLAPLGPVYQAGTLSGNPVAMAAGLATLKQLRRDGFYEELEAKTERLTAGLAEAARGAGVGFHTTQAGGMFGLFFTDQTRISRFDEVMACDQPRFNGFFHAMLDRGVYLAPSAFEAGFVSITHSDDDIDATIQAARDAFNTL